MLGDVSNVMFENEQPSTPLSSMANDRRHRRGKIKLTDLSQPQRKRFCDKSAEEAVNNPNLEYLACAQRVADTYGLQLCECDRTNIKNAISRRAAAARQLVSLLTSMDSNSCPQSSDEQDPAPTANNKPVTARGKERHLTGRKPNDDITLRSDTTKRPYKGASSQFNYSQAVKDEVVKAVKDLNENGRSIRYLGTTMRAALAEQGIQIGLRRCQHYITMAKENDGKAISPQRPGGVFLPAGLEREIASTVKWFRERKMPVFPEDVKEWANQEIDGTPFQENFPGGKVTEGWYRRFLRRNDMVTGHLRPLEMARHQWYTEANLAQYYEVAKELLLKAGVAVLNREFDSEVKYSQELRIIHPERIASFDETKAEMDCTKGGKGNSDTIVRAGMDDDGEGVVTKSSACASAVCGRLADNRTLPAMIIFNSGESLDATWCPNHSVPDICDKDGRPLCWQYQCNEKGSMTEDFAVTYVRNVLHPALGYPPPRDTNPGEQGVVICDGVGVHIGFRVLQECIKHGIEVLLRVPNLSCKLQGEDLINFLFLKVRFVIAWFYLITVSRSNFFLQEPLICSF